MTPHRTPAERLRAERAAAAVARVNARAGLTTHQEDHQDPAAAYPVTPATARAIREALDAERTQP